jgi:hypothetical protein
MYVVVGADEVDEAETVGFPVWCAVTTSCEVWPVGVGLGIGLDVGAMVVQPDVTPIMDKTMVSAVIAFQPIFTFAFWFLYLDLCQFGLHMKHLSSVSKKSLHV